MPLLYLMRNYPFPTPDCEWGNLFADRASLPPVAAKELQNSSSEWEYYLFELDTGQWGIANNWKLKPGEAASLPQPETRRPCRVTNTNTSSLFLWKEDNPSAPYRSVTRIIVCKSCCSSELINIYDDQSHQICMLKTSS